MIPSEIECSECFTGFKVTEYNRLWRVYIKKVVLFERRTLRSETIFDYWKPFKNDEKPILFHLKSPFYSQYI